MATWLSLNVASSFMTSADELKWRCMWNSCVYKILYEMCFVCRKGNASTAWNFIVL